MGVIGVFLRDDVEKRLHRVKIAFNKIEIKCKYANQCSKAENCDRCNKFYLKCTFFKQN